MIGLEYVLFLFLPKLNSLPNLTSVSVRTLPSLSPKQSWWGKVDWTSPTSDISQQPTLRWERALPTPIIPMEEKKVIQAPTAKKNGGLEWYKSHNFLRMWFLATIFKKAPGKKNPTTLQEIKEPDKKKKKIMIKKRKLSPRKLIMEIEGNNYK